MRVLVTEPARFPEEAHQALVAAGHTVAFNACALPLAPAALKDVDAVFVRLGMRWTAAIFAHCPGLKLIATPTTGLTHIDMEAAKRHGVDVLSLGGLPGLEQLTSTPEHALALLLALARQLVPACLSTQEGHWDRYAFTGTMLSRKTVGIVGMGRTGRMFARMVAAMEMDVHYYDPYVDEPDYQRHTSLEALAAMADVISVHAVLNDETRGLLGRSFFAHCKPGALLVNTARGELLDEAALIAALQDGRLAGAALDVVAQEPATGAPWRSPLQQYCRAHRNLLVTPHIAGATVESIPRAERMIADAFIERCAARAGGARGPLRAVESGAGEPPVDGR